MIRHRTTIALLAATLPAAIVILGVAGAAVSPGSAVPVNPKVSITFGGAGANAPPVHPAGLRGVRHP